MKVMKIIKRSGQEIPFDISKIEGAIRKASLTVDYKNALADGGINLIVNEINDRNTPTMKTHIGNQIHSDATAPKTIWHLIKKTRSRTNDWFASILQNTGIGCYRPDNGRRFDRNLLFSSSAIGKILLIYAPEWVNMIKANYDGIHAAAIEDAEITDIFDYIENFRHEWEDFIDELYHRLPDSDASLISDFQDSALAMFDNLQNSFTCAQADTSNAKGKLEDVKLILPLLKKTFIRESSAKRATPQQCFKTIEEAVEYYDTESKREREACIAKIKSVQGKFAMLSALAGQPFKFVRDSLKDGIQAINSGKPICPKENLRWQEVLKPILNYNPVQHEFSIADEDDEHTFCIDGPNGESFTLAWHEIKVEEKEICSEIRDLTKAYVDAGVALSKQINSSSSTTWKQAKQLWNECHQSFLMPSTRPAINQMVDHITSAVRGLCIDIDNNIDNTEESASSCNKRDEAHQEFFELGQIIRNKIELHSFAKTVHHIKHAKKGDPCYTLCLQARKIAKEWGWKESTMLTYIKGKPKATQKAISKRAKSQKCRRNKKELIRRDTIPVVKSGKKR